MNIQSIRTRFKGAYLSYHTSFFLHLDYFSVQSCRSYFRSRPRGYSVTCVYTADPQLCVVQASRDEEVKTSRIFCTKFLSTGIHLLPSRIKGCFELVASKRQFNVTLTTGLAGFPSLIPTIYFGKALAAALCLTLALVFLFFTFLAAAIC